MNTKSIKAQSPPVIAKLTTTLYPQVRSPRKMLQSNSPILRLPRELRDRIYIYALVEPDGYRYEGKTKRLRTSRDKPINLSLVYTCKQIYSETCGVALTTNCITFTPQHDSSSAVYASNSDRLKSLHERYLEALRIMIAWMADKVTSGHLDALCSLHPSNDDVRELRRLDHAQRLPRLMRGEVVMGEIGHGGMMNTARRSIATMHILRDFVKLLSEHETFYTTTAKEYDTELRNGQVPPHLVRSYEVGWYAGRPFVDKKYAPSYTPNSQKELIETIVEPWRIMEESDLLHLESLLPMRKIISWREEEPDDESLPDSNSKTQNSKPHVPPKLRVYYSATACAVYFLNGLSKDTREYIRNISIIEDHVIPSHPASHAHGLIPFCQENPRLHVETQLDILGVLFYRSWSSLSKSLRVRGVLWDLAEYLREAILLPTMGMPPGQYKLELRGRISEMTQHVWDQTRKVAEIHHAATELYRRHPEEGKSHILKHPPSPDFYSLVRRVLEGDTAVWFDACMGPPWDLVQAVRELESSPKMSDSCNFGSDLVKYKQQVEDFDALNSRYRNY